MGEFIGDSMASRFKDIENRLDVLESASRLIRSAIRDGALEIQDASGNVILRVGKQPDGTYALWVMNLAGNALLKIGQQADSTYALWALNAAGAARLKIGDLGSSVYDAAILDPGGSGNTVKLSSIGFGVGADTIATGEGTTSTSFTDLATVGPTVTATIGSSGRAVVIASSFINPDADFNTGDIGVSIDGAAAALYGENVGLATGVKVGETITGAKLVTGLTAGARQFRMKYKSGGLGTGALFQDRTLVVIPY